MTDLTFNIEKVVGNVSIAEKVSLKENITFAELVSATSKLFDDKLVLKIAASTGLQTVISVDNPELQVIDHFLESAKKKEYYYYNNTGDLYIAFSEVTHEKLNKINMENIDKRPKVEEDNEENELKEDECQDDICENCREKEAEISILSRASDLIKTLESDSTDTSDYSLSSDFDEKEDDFKLDDIINMKDRPKNPDSIDPSHLIE